MKKGNLLFFLVILVIISGSCKKNKSYNLNPDINAANATVLSEYAFNYVFTMIARAASDSALAQNHQAMIDSAIVTYDPGSGTYLFMYSGKYCADSVMRNGRFKASMNGNFFTPGTVSDVTFLSYYEGYYAVTGKDSIVNLGLTQGSGTLFSNYITGGELIVVVPQYKVIRWKSLNQFSFPTGFFYPGSDKVIYTTGSGSGVSSEGYSFSASILDSLVTRFDCPFIYSGIIGLSIPDQDVTTGSIDFITSDGCANRMNYDFGGNVFYYSRKPDYMKN
jgi:hypothetical protein